MLKFLKNKMVFLVMSLVFSLSSNLVLAAPTAYLEYDGVKYPNRVKLTDNRSSALDTCDLVIKFERWIKQNYRDNNLDPQNDGMKFNALNKEFYEKFKAIQLNLVKGNINSMYCMIPDVTYPTIRKILNKKFNGTKYEPFAKWFENEERLTYKWIYK